MNDNSTEAPQSITYVIYYKGVSMTITQRDPLVNMDNFIASKKREIDGLLTDVNCKPSWNPDTNKAVTQPLAEQKKTIHVEQSQANPTTDWLAGGEGIVCETCGAKATMKNGISQKSGKPWRGVFCSIDKKHVKWLRG